MLNNDVHKNKKLGIGEIGCIIDFWQYYVDSFWFDFLFEWTTAIVHYAIKWVELIQVEVDLTSNTFYLISNDFLYGLAKMECGKFYIITSTNKPANVEIKIFKIVFIRDSVIEWDPEL